MTSNFKNTVEAHKALISSDYPVSGKTEFYSGDHEVGQFFVYQQFGGGDHSKSFNTLVEIRNTISKLFQVELEYVSHSGEWTETHKGKVNGVTLEVTTEYIPLHDWGTGRIFFKFIGKELKSKKDYSEFQNVNLGSVFHSSWGYDMTVCQFFQVVRRSGNTIYTKKLKTQIVDGCEDGYKMPMVNNFDGEEVFRSKLGSMDKTTYSYIGKKYSTLWDGNKKYFNTLD